MITTIVLMVVSFIFGALWRHQRERLDIEFEELEASSRIRCTIIRDDSGSGFWGTGATHMEALQNALARCRK